MPDPTIKLPPTPALRAALVVGMDLAASGEADESAAFVTTHPCLSAELEKEQGDAESK